MFHDALPKTDERPRRAASPVDFIAWFLVLLVVAIAAHKGL